MTRRRTNRYSVFEFDEEDESVETKSKEYIKRFKKPKKCGKSVTRVDKGKFLQFFSKASCPGVAPNKTTICLDVEGKIDSGNDIYDVDASFLSTSSTYESEEVCEVSGDCEMIERDYSPDSRFSHADEQASPKLKILSNGLNGCEALKVAAEKAEVVLPASFIVFGDTVYTEAVVIFSCTCFKIEASVIGGNKGAFSSEWSVDDIVKIKSQWNRKVENATVSISLNSKGSGDVRLATRSSGFESLQFSVDDFSWPEREKAIKLLNDKYCHTWKDLSDTDGETADIAVTGPKENFSSRPYLAETIANSSGPSTTVVYPKDDPDAVSLGKRELEVLQPETFIDDTIIDFYIKYLKRTVRPGEEPRFHFFNCFFFRKLADQDRDLVKSCESREAFERVRKWTKNVDIFLKDYIFIPVNYSLHWSLVVICHPGEVANLKDETGGLLRESCILHMNSIKGSHRGLKNLFQSYLCEEWKERHHDGRDDISSKFLHVPFISLELPQQQNSYDCGLFVLHYVELFLREAPDNFSYLRIKDSSNFLSRNWFDPSDASKKRIFIQELISGILKDQFRDGPSDNNGQESPVLSDESWEETEVQIVDKMYSSTFHAYDCEPDSNMRPEMKIVAKAALSPVIQQRKDRVPLFKLSELKISPSSFYGKDFRQEETEVQIVNKMYSSTSDAYDCKPDSNMRPEIKLVTETALSPVVRQSKDHVRSFKWSQLKISASSFYGKGFQQSSTLHKGNLMSPIQEVEENSVGVVANSQSEVVRQQIPDSVAGSHDIQTLEMCNSPESSVEILDLDENQNQNQNIQEHEVSSVCLRSEKCEATSVSSEDLEDCIIEDSQEGDDSCEVSIIRCIAPSLPNRPQHQEPECISDIYIEEVGKVTSTGDSMARDDHPVLKRSKYITIS